MAIGSGSRHGGALRALLGLVAALLISASAASAAPTIHVNGTHLVDGQGHRVQLLGINRSSGEYNCAQGYGFFDGPVDTRAVNAMKTWHINVVRVPLNEACWLGLSTVKPSLRGKNYQHAIRAFVSRLHKAGFYVILDLHWNAPGNTPALSLQVMADADHSPAFWRSVARTFRGDRSMLFDLHNEPHDVSWRCWRDGCTTKDGWRTAGMSSLVKAVRSVGAHQPILLGGLTYSSDLRQWWRYRPKDSRHSIVASYHTYSDQCDGPSCWQTYLNGVYRHVPLVTGELGEYDCGTSYVTPYMKWADTRGISYLGWAWGLGTCTGGPNLIENYGGTPTPFGKAFRDHFRHRRP